MMCTVAEGAAGTGAEPPGRLLTVMGDAGALWSGCDEFMYELCMNFSLFARSFRSAATGARRLYACTGKAIINCQGGIHTNTKRGSDIICRDPCVAVKHLCLSSEMVHCQTNAMLRLHTSFESDSTHTLLWSSLMQAYKQHVRICDAVICPEEEAAHHSCCNNATHHPSHNGNDDARNDTF